MSKIYINDLRIGNWVALHDAALKIDCLNSGGRINNPIQIAEKIHSIITCDNIHPIPITRNMVETLGFEEFEEGAYELKMRKQLPFSEMLVARVNNAERNEFWATVMEPGHDCKPYAWRTGDVLSIHQLQNLFHAITGEELIKSYLQPKKLNNVWILSDIAKI